MSSILIQSPSFEMVKCDSCVNPVPLALAYRIEDAAHGDRHMLACSLRCANDIALKLEQIAHERSQKEPLAKSARDLSKLHMNVQSFVPLHQAHELAVRKNELYEAIQIVEGCGASPELTEAVVRLGARAQHISDDLASICAAAFFWGK